MAKDKYQRQRARVNPPAATLGQLRKAQGLTQPEVLERYEIATGKTLTVGALSGIENGLRGASEEVLSGLEVALNLKPLGDPSRILFCDYSLASQAKPAA